MCMYVYIYICIDINRRIPLNGDFLADHDDSSIPRPHGSKETSIFHKVGSSDWFVGENLNRKPWSLL